MRTGLSAFVLQFSACPGEQAKTPASESELAEEEAADLPLSLMISGHASLTVHQADLEPYALEAGRYDLAAVLAGQGVRSYRFIQAGGRRLSSTQVVKGGFVLRRAGTGFALEGGAPTELLEFAALHVLDSNFTQAPAPLPKLAEVPLSVGGRTWVLTASVLRGLPKIPAKGRAHMVSLDAVLKHFRVESKAAMWVVTSKLGKRVSVAASSSRLALRVNRRGHMHLMVAEEGDGFERAQRYRFIRALTDGPE